MPGPTLPNMSIVLPAVDGDSGLWDVELNAGLTLLDGHDHTTGKGLPITTAAIEIDADLDIAGHGLVNVGGMTLAAIATPTTGAQRIYVDVNDHELYYRAADGTNIKITNVDTLNLSLVGGIVGDYAAVGAEVAYDDANDRYTFKQQGAPKTWARLASGDVRLYETGTNESIYVGLKAPAALAASFDITMPLVLPGGVSLMQLSNTGVITASNTIAPQVTLAGGVAGTTAFAVEIDVPTVVASANYKHTYTKWRLVSAAAAIVDNGGGATFSASALAWLPGVYVGRVVYPLPIEFGDRIVAWRLQVQNASASGTITARLYKKSAGPIVETETPLGTAATTSAAGGAYVTLGNIGLTIDSTDSIYEQFYIVVTGAGINGDSFFNAVVGVTRP